MQFIQPAGAAGRATAEEHASASSTARTATTVAVDGDRRSAAAARADAVGARDAGTSAPPRCCCSPRSHATATRSCRRSRSAAAACGGPALAQWEDEGLIRTQEEDGHKLFVLTDAGKALVDERGADRPAPWEQQGGDSGEAHELGKLIRDLA